MAKGKDEKETKKEFKASNIISPEIADKSKNCTQITAREAEKSEGCPYKKCKCICLCVCVIAILIISIAISITIGIKISIELGAKFGNELYVFLLCLAHIVAWITTIICATYLTAKMIDKKSTYDSNIPNSSNNIHLFANDEMPEV